MSKPLSRVIQWVDRAVRQGRGWSWRMATESRTAAVLDTLKVSFSAHPIRVLSIAGMAAMVGNTAVFVFGRSSEITAERIEWRLLLFLLALSGRWCEVSGHELIRTSRVVRRWVGDAKRCRPRSP